MTPLIKTPSAQAVIGCAIQVHRALGPGLLESPYVECLKYELTLRNVRFRTQVALPIVYDTHRLDCGYRLDFVIDNELIVEVKSVERLLPLHTAQVVTYLKLSGFPQALLVNFNVPVMKDGIRSLLQPAGGSRRRISRFRRTDGSSDAA